MSHDEFTKLYVYMSHRFDALEAQLATKASQADMDRVLSSLDNLEKRMEISEDERLVMGHQINRLDRWTHELADKIGHKLTA